MATAAVSKKRKRTVLTLEKKIEIIKALEKGSSQRVVGERFEVAKSTIADIWKDRKKIIDALGSTESPSFVNKKRPVIHQAKFVLVDEAVGNGFANNAQKVLQCLVCYSKRNLGNFLQSYNILMLMQTVLKEALDG